MDLYSCVHAKLCTPINSTTEVTEDAHADRNTMNGKKARLWLASTAYVPLLVVLADTNSALTVSHVQNVFRFQYEYTHWQHCTVKNAQCPSGLPTSHLIILFASCLEYRTENHTKTKSAAGCPLQSV
jgi:hypothetical protein